MFFSPVYNVLELGGANPRRWDNVLLFVYHRQSSATYTSHDVLFPFFHTSKDGDRRVVQVRPLFWHESNSTKGFTVALPIYYHRWRAGHRVRHVAPFFWSKRSPDHDFTHLWPFYGSARWRVGGREFRKTSVAAPLFSYTSSDDGFYKRLDLLFPLFRHEVAGDDRLTWAFPIYFHGESGPPERRSGHTVVMPLYYDLRSPEDRFRMVLPLYAGYESGRDHTRIMLPTVLDHRRGDKHFFHVWPFWGHHEVGEHFDRYFVAAPFFSYTDDRKARAKQVDFLWPLVQVRKEPERTKVRVIPLGFHDSSPERSETLLLPLYYRRSTEQSRLFVSLAYSGGRDRKARSGWDNVLGLVYHRTFSPERRSLDILFPIFHKSSIGPEDAPDFSTTQLRPLLWHERRGEEGFTIGLPLLWHFWNKRSEALNVVPFYTRIRRHDGSELVSILGPAYLSRQRGGVRRTDMLWPFVHSFDDGVVRKFQVRPLFWSYRSERRSYTRLVPFVFHERERVGGLDESQVHVLPPLFFHGKAGDASRWFVLWQLLTYEREGQDTDLRLLFEAIRARREGDTRTFSILWRLLRYEESPSGYDFAILWKLLQMKREEDAFEMHVMQYLFRYQKRPDHFLLEINPLFAVEKTPKHTYFSVGGGLISVTKRRNDTELGLLYFLKI